MKHYSIDSKSKVITAMISRLTDKEMAEIQRYVAFGYTVEDGKPAEKVSVKRLDNAYIVEYLKDDEAATATYEAAKQEPVVVDGVIQTRKNKKGETVNKEKGFNTGRNWFAKTYPKSVSELKLTEKQKKEIEDAYKVYSEKNKDEADAMKKDEYTKYYYWTKIFVQK